MYNSQVSIMSVWEIVNTLGYNEPTHFYGHGLFINIREWIYGK